MNLRSLYAKSVLLHFQDNSGGKVSRKGYQFLYLSELMDETTVPLILKNGRHRYHEVFYTGHVRVRENHEGEGVLI